MSDNIFKSVVTAQNFLSRTTQGQEILRAHEVMAEHAEQQKTLEAVIGHKAFAQLDEYKRMLDKGRNLLSHYETEQRSIPSAKPLLKTTETILSLVSDLGTIVRQKRKDMGLTQQQFADITGVGRRFISELEAGKPTLEFGRILKVCQSIGIDLTAVQR